MLERRDRPTEVTWSTTQRYDQEFKQGRLSLSYDRSSSIAGVLGQAAIIQGFIASASLQPTRNLTLGLDGSIRDTEPSDRGGPGGDFLAYSASCQINYRLLRWLSLAGGYHYQRQDDQGRPHRELGKNVLFLNLTASDAFRAY